MRAPIASTRHEPFVEPLVASVLTVLAAVSAALAVGLLIALGSTSLDRKALDPLPRRRCPTARARC